MRVADQQPPVGVDLDAERSPAGVRDPVEPATVVGDPEDAAVRRTREDRALVAAAGADDDVLGAGSGHGDHLEVHAANLAIGRHTSWRWIDGLSMRLGGHPDDARRHRLEEGSVAIRASVTGSGLIACSV